VVEGELEFNGKGRFMFQLTLQQRELVAIGASLASNCIPCIKFHIRQGREAGLTNELIREAVEVADSVRQMPAKKVFETAIAALATDRASSRDTKGKPSCEVGDDERVSDAAAGPPCCGLETGP
jgi:AhpD family alkylhydroperoxidase